MNDFFVFCIFVVVFYIILFVFLILDFNWVFVYFIGMFWLDMDSLNFFWFFKIGIFGFKFGLL